jgi:hypothetical protein
LSETSNALLPLLFNITLEYIWKIQENLYGLKLTGTHQLLAYADDINIVGQNGYNKEKHKVLLDASKEVVLEVSPEKTKCVLMSC